jgi:hypothetical protein
VHRPFAHQRERAVRQRREVARAAERAVLRHDRRDARRQQGRVRLGRLPPHAGAPGRQRRQPQEHQRAHDLALDRGAGPRRVRADQRALQLGPQVGRDLARGERAEAGRDAVVRLRVAGERVDDRARALDLRQRLVRQHDARTAARDRDDVVDARRPDAYRDLCHTGIQGASRSSVQPAAPSRR